MGHTNTIPEVFGASWTKFVDEWCLGAPPVEPSEVCARALHALTNHLPEHVQRILSDSMRGLGVIAGNIDLGLTLSDTEGLPRFAQVVSRLRAGERSAKSELTVAATLSRMGFPPALQVEAGTKIPDLAITVGGSVVYGEVVAPERAEIVKEIEGRIGEIASAVLAGCGDANVELFLDFDPWQVDIPSVMRFVADSPHVFQPTEIPEVGRFVKRPFTFPPVIAPTIDSGTPGTIVGLARSNFCVTDRLVTGGSVVSIRAPVFDSRAKRILTAELHHFTKSAANFVVIDCGGTAGAANEWIPALTRCFQPKQNTRVSGVLLFFGGLTGNPLQVHRVWEVLPNPYAANPLPSGLLKAFERLPSKWPREAPAQ